MSVKLPPENQPKTIGSWDKITKDTKQNHQNAKIRKIYHRDLPPEIGVVGGNPDNRLLAISVLGKSPDTLQRALSSKLQSGVRCRREARI